MLVWRKIGLEARWMQSLTGDDRMRSNILTKRAVITGTTGQVVGLDVNTGMLNMARAMCLSPETVITWEEADAASLPFPKACFDVVLCQQGLQYFSDRKGALREMVRVLTPSGRLALSVWRPLERLPFFVALVNALEHHLGADVAAPLQCGLYD